MDTTRRTWSLSQHLFNSHKSFLAPVFATALIASLLVIPTASASRNGVIQKTNSFTVGFTYTDNGIARVCSGALIAPTIIATAGHCVLSPGNHKGTDYIFAPPGTALDAPIDPSKPLPKVVNVITAPNYVPTNSNEIDDLAFIELDRPLATTGFIRITTQGEFESFTSTSKMAGYGFGAVYETNAPYSSLVRKYELDLPTKTLIPGLTSMYDIGSKNAVACSGDSGGPITVVNPAGVEVLVGVLSGAAAIQGSCGTKAADDLFHMRFTVVDPFLSLLGSKYNPAVIFAPPAKKIIKITCIKGKLKKVVSGTNPKCPAGYKKK